VLASAHKHTELLLDSSRNDHTKKLGMHNPRQTAVKFQWQQHSLTINKHIKPGVVVTTVVVGVGVGVGVVGGSVRQAWLIRR